MTMTQIFSDTELVDFFHQTQGVVAFVCETDDNLLWMEERLKNVNINFVPYDCNSDQSTMKKFHDHMEKYKKGSTFLFYSVHGWG